MSIMGRAVSPHTFYFGEEVVTVDVNIFNDYIFEDPYRFCDWLLEYQGWRYLDHACENFHIDDVQMLATWAEAEAAKLPEEIRNPVDGTVHDLPTVVRFLAGALPWKLANHRFTDAYDVYLDEPPTIAGEEAVRAAAKELISAALGLPPPYRDSMVKRSLVWTDFVDRRWLQGLNIPPP
ncbi:MAG TPA: hypothetical protein VGG02_01040 [Chthoniobacterales bacterium]|jgi:hypothetical protein